MSKLINAIRRAYDRAFPYVTNAPELLPSQVVPPYQYICSISKGE